MNGRAMTVPKRMRTVHIFMERVIIASYSTLQQTFSTPPASRDADPLHFENNVSSSHTKAFNRPKLRGVRELLSLYYTGFVALRLTLSITRNLVRQQVHLISAAGGGTSFIFAAI